ncbi:hypothetical protein EVAR_20826_1 [Eumeta japonica]|uniref:Uncharacterized protein n=1 Tax=Eumeta variegata TaxID=151549 RepID=A0A4C1UEV4_EUMVA|nr:hypothetical protein EVAR_20826_1 [Eumeta japonica]
MTPNILTTTLALLGQYTSGLTLLAVVNRLCGRCELSTPWLRLGPPLGIPGHGYTRDATTVPPPPPLRRCLCLDTLTPLYCHHCSAVVPEMDNATAVLPSFLNCK